MKDDKQVQLKLDSYFNFYYLLVQGSANLFLFRYITLVCYPSFPKSDQLLTSPYNFNTFSRRRVMRIKIIIN